MSWVGKIKTKTDGWGAKKKSHIDSAQCTTVLPYTLTEEEEESQAD